ncbi:acid sphingomyelinase-like phosphodiesterase 3a isoform X2 [Mercenaria mercenaria]|nr:acid sphingomyelinase-like phosphodiesterase 3a isoform X2 [Mercenaria mercenaria]
MGLFGNIWCDPPWTLVESSVQAMKSIKPDVDFLLWTGDSVLHADVAKINHTFNGIILDNATELFKTTFPDTPVYASFGNHDSYPMDQFKPRNTALYNETLARWRTWIDDSSQDENFRKGGFYTVKTAKNIRIVALNTNIYYKDNKAVHAEGDPAGQFDWLTQTLEAARQKKEKVIITGHIAPGFQLNQETELYTHQNGRLVKILKQYYDVISAMHFGHEHADVLKLLRNGDGVPLIPVFLAPSVTPITLGPLHNPGIRLVKYDRVTGTHIDISQYYLDLHAANKAEIARWKLEYNTSGAYGLPDLSPEALDNLIDKMKDPASHEFKRYWKYYVVSPADEFIEDCDTLCHATVICGMTEFIQADFVNCFAEIIISLSVRVTYCMPLLGLSLSLSLFLFM